MSIGKKFPDILDWVDEIRDALKTTFPTAEKCGVTKKQLINCLVAIKLRA